MLPYTSAVPGVVIVVIGLAHALNYCCASAGRKWQPRWTRPFVPEYPPESEELRSAPARAKQRLGWVLSLLVVSVGGLVAHVAQLMALGWDATTLVLAISWVSKSSRVVRPDAVDG